MLRWILLAVLVVAITATATIVMQSVPADTKGTKVDFPVPPASKPTGPLPRAVVDGDLTYNFGAKAQKITLERDWTIRNEGKGSLVVELEAPACSCTVANFQSKDGKANLKKLEIPPGGQHNVHFTWETRENTGHYRKPVNLLTNDPEHPKFVFAAEGEVQPAIIIYPDNRGIAMLNLSTDLEDHQAKFAIYSPDRPDMKLTELTSSKPDIIVLASEPLSEDEQKQLKAKAGHRIIVKVKRGLPLGSFREDIVIKTDHPNQPEITLPITGKMVGPITIIPEKLMMHDISAKAGGVGKVTLLSRGGRETVFTVAKKPENLKVEVVPGESVSKTRKYDLTITVPPGASPGRIEDVIILKTDHPQAPELRVPINLFVRDAD